MRLTDDPTIVGVIGGGQLCRMMCEAATPLGLEVVFLDPTPDAPARPVARRQIVGEFDDRDAVAKLVQASDVLTYDIELADPTVIESLDPPIPVHPDPKTLRLIQDKYRQKTALDERGIPVPAFESVETANDLKEARDEKGLPLMLKAREGGYDGRGNLLLESENTFEAGISEVSGRTMVEEFVDYDRELSVIGVRGPTKTDVYPATETVHRDEILRRTLTPARTTETVLERARGVARQVLEVMEGRGVYGIELFEVDGSILVNEVAPRPHNSGHWTIEGAETSQFEQHLRAVTGLPPGSTDLRCPTVSVNILGVDGERTVNLGGVERILDEPRVHLHWYGKKLERPLRKMGHFTLTGSDLDRLVERAQILHDRLRFQP